MSINDDLENICTEDIDMDHRWDILGRYRVGRSAILVEDYVSGGSPNLQDGEIIYFDEFINNVDDVQWVLDNVYYEDGYPVDTYIVQ